MWLAKYYNNVINNLDETLFSNLQMSKQKFLTTHNNFGLLQTLEL